MCGRGQLPDRLLACGGVFASREFGLGLFINARKNFEKYL
jgi:hypothetical protein